MDANSGEPWSEMDLEDLRHSLGYGEIFAAAEVRQKHGAGLNRAPRQARPGGLLKKAPPKRG